MSELAARLRRAFILSLKDQSALAAETGYSVSMIDKILNGRPGPSVKAKAAVAQALKVAFDVESEIAAHEFARKAAKMEPMPKAEQPLISLNVAPHVAMRIIDVSKEAGVSESEVVEAIFDVAEVVAAGLSVSITSLLKKHLGGTIQKYTIRRIGPRSIDQRISTGHH